MRRCRPAVLAAATVASVCLWPFPVTTASTEERRGADPAGQAVVFIRVIGDVEGLPDPVFRRAGYIPGPLTNLELATGTGFLVAPGQILTCRHLIADSEVSIRAAGTEIKAQRRVRRIEVMPPGAGTAGGEPERYEVSVVATSEELDLAVLSIGASGLPWLDLGDSDAAEPGDPVDAVGYPFGEKVEIGRPVAPNAPAPDVSVSRGNLSAFRTDDQGVRRFVQTTAALNPGNSGGPLLDADGNVVGIVSRRLSGGGAANVGFAVAINAVKDFLESHGLDGQLPARRMALGPLHAFEAKGLRVRLPFGMMDSSPFRTTVDTGGGVPTPLRIDRLVSPWDAARVAALLTGGQAFERFTSAGTPVQRLRQVDGRRVLVGRASGMLPDGTQARMEYAVVDLGQEKVVARYVGAPNLLAYNASIFRASLASLEADALRKDSVSPLVVTDWVTGDAVRSVPALAGLVVPSAWFQEPAGAMPCRGLAPAAEMIAASPVSDFARSFRASIIRQADLSPAAAAAACGTPVEGDSDRYARRVTAFGAGYAVEGRFLAGAPGELLQVESVAPVEHQAAMRQLLDQWLRRLAAARKAATAEPSPAHR